MIVVFPFLGIIYTQRNQNQYTIKILVYTCLLWQSRMPTVALFIIHRLKNQSKDVPIDERINKRQWVLYSYIKKI